MSHLAKALALSVVLSCSGSQPAEPPAAVPVAEPAQASEATAAPTPEPPAAAPPSAGDASLPVEPAPAATGAESVPQTLFVGAARVSCQGEAPQQCLQVRETKSQPYRNLYSSIEGFDYEPSYEYELRVEATFVPHPPADASAVRYRLLEVVSKRKASAAQSP
jgi:hypothetical protein